MRPIALKAEEYEKAIQGFLGISPMEKNKYFEVKKKPEPMRDMRKTRPKSSLGQKMQAKDEVWAKEMERINFQERSLQKNLMELDKKQKKMQRDNKVSKVSAIATKDNELIKSLAQANKIITKLIQSSSPKKASPTRH